ncbi:hypothetical protein HDU91_004726, partial [Kappamyces sp. JEL0680]
MGRSRRQEKIMPPSSASDRSDGSMNFVSAKALFDSDPQKYQYTRSVRLTQPAPPQPLPAANPAGPKRLGNTSRTFVSPLVTGKPAAATHSNSRDRSPNDDGNVDPRLLNVDAAMVETIRNEIVSNLNQVTWDDIAGLALAKQTQRVCCVAHDEVRRAQLTARPDLFQGIRAPPKGLLLFGPPGTGKTLIGKCIASQVQATFFSISSSSLTSKWIGDGEKMVRALFAVARVHQPS